MQILYIPPTFLHTSLPPFLSLTWEKEETRIDVEGYKWFGKPRIKQNSSRGDGGVVFLLRECLVNEVEFINTVKYEESVWMKIRSERGREALYIGCVYMPTCTPFPRNFC